MSWFQTVPPEVTRRCQEYAQAFSIADDWREKLAGNKGWVHRTRMTREGDSVVRTELTTLLASQVFVDLKPMGAVVILLEIAKRSGSPKRLTALQGARAGEYANGALEAAWGIPPGSGGAASLGLRFPGEPRTLTLQQVVDLAESVL